VRVKTKDGGVGRHGLAMIASRDANYSRLDGCTAPQLRDAPVRRV